VRCDSNNIACIWNERKHDAQPFKRMFSFSCSYLIQRANFDEPLRAVCSCLHISLVLMP
jgi:hypothetical protein